ncbi:hypothetical protein [Sporohalobacter salinus]|uniref:hypothetical protein n=1 Tax=Sporohalobacter salinus TaxID=1494606 RepID=UPI00195F4629|nr:hypothetical protein [Sporohalobacter salinus]MBM7624104.1 thiamine pyrophosphate-dependent acetolactate synthase large subunit-like protein [Sporohalobacter salinus]
MRKINICVISSNQTLIDDISFMISHLNKVIKKYLEEDKNSTPGDDYNYKDMIYDDVFYTLLKQIAQYLSKQRKQFVLDAYYYETFKKFRQAAKEGKIEFSDDSAFEFFIVYKPKFEQRLSGNQRFTNKKEELISICNQNDIETKISPNSFIFYIDKKRLDSWIFYSSGGYHLRLFDCDATDRRADLLRLIMNHLEQTRFNKILSRYFGKNLSPVTIAQEIKQFMRSQCSEKWDFYFYTGSAIATFIESMTDSKSEISARCFTGPSEHSLACGALSSWLLYNREYVIAITMGMIDEFRGTLANLQRAKANGFIICAESKTDTWQPFQGTINQESDGLEVIEARGLSYVYIEKTNEIADKLEEAFRLYLKKGGPVVIFATQQVLDSRSGQKIEISYAKEKATTFSEIKITKNEEFKKALKVINETPSHILWQCDNLTDSQRELVYEIAEQAGIALADSLIYPGSVSRYWKGEKIHNYLGSLAIYGYSRRIYKFLHNDHRLADKEEQCLFFINSRIGQVATPISEPKLKRRLQVAQVNNNLEYMSPFTDIPINIPTTQFLRNIKEELAVKPYILKKRKNKIDELNKVSKAMPCDQIGSLPFSLGYFFEQLRTLVKELIENQGYQYTGVFEVGRSGAYAICKMPLTNQGFSGWYGRALMGDGLMALPYVAVNTPLNVIAFIGDGARGLVPNIEEQLISKFTDNPKKMKNKNVTVFCMVNGNLSMIQSYIDYQYSRWGSTQTISPVHFNRKQKKKFNSVSVCRKTIVDFDASMLKEALTCKERINFFDVFVSHSMRGDGLSPLTEKLWDHEKL